MTLFVGPVGGDGGPGIKNATTIRHLFPGSKDVRVLSTVPRGPLRLGWCMMRVASSRDEQIIIATSRGGRSRLFPLLLRKARRNPRLRYSLICIGGTIADEVRHQASFLPLLRAASVVSVETEGVARELAALGIENICLMPNMVDDLRPALPRVSFGDETMRFVFLSSLQNAKGIKTMLAAFRAVLSCGFRASLDIYGPIRPSFDTKLLDDLGKRAEPIAYRGAVAHDEVCEVLRGYHCFVFPSEYETEGFPAVLAEAQAAGLAIIASDVAYNPEIVVDGRNGLVFPAGDAEALAAAIMRMCEDRPFAERVSRENSSNSMRFDAATVVSRYADELRMKGWTL